MIQQEQQQQQRQIPLPFLESGGLPVLSDIGEGKVNERAVVILGIVASGFCGLGILVGGQINGVQLRSAQQEVLIQKGKTAEYEQQFDIFCEKAGRTRKK